MANSTADCHVTGFFEGLLTTKTPRIFVSTYTATNPTNSETLVDNKANVLNTDIFDDYQFQGEQTENKLQYRPTETISEENNRNEKGIIENENRHEKKIENEKDKTKNSTVEKSNSTSKKKKENDHDGKHLSDDFLARDSGREKSTSRNSNPGSIHSNKKENVPSSRDKDVMEKRNLNESLRDLNKILRNFNETCRNSNDEDDEFFDEKEYDDEISDGEDEFSDEEKYDDEISDRNDEFSKEEYDDEYSDKKEYDDKISDGEDKFSDTEEDSTMSKENTPSPELNWIQGLLLNNSSIKKANCPSIEKYFSKLQHKLDDILSNDEGISDNESKDTNVNDRQFDKKILPRDSGREYKNSNTNSITLNKNENVPSRGNKIVISNPTVQLEKHNLNSNKEKVQNFELAKLQVEKTKPSSYWENRVTKKLQERALKRKIQDSNSLEHEIAYMQVTDKFNIKTKNDSTNNERNIFTDEDDNSTSNSLATRKGRVLDCRSARKLNNSLASAMVFAVNFSQHDEEHYGAGEHKLCDSDHAPAVVLTVQRDKEYYGAGKHKFCDSDHKFYDDGSSNKVYNDREFDDEQIYGDGRQRIFDDGSGKFSKCDGAFPSGGKLTKYGVIYSGDGGGYQKILDNGNNNFHDDCDQTVYGDDNRKVYDGEKFCHEGYNNNGNADSVHKFQDEIEHSTQQYDDGDGYFYDSGDHNSHSGNAYFSDRDGDQTVPDDDADYFQHDGHHYSDDY